MKRLDRVVVYGSLGLRRGVSDLLWAFRKSSKLEEFPAYLDDHPFQVIQRIKAETQNGLKTADVVLMPHYAVSTLARDGYLENGRPGGLESLPPNIQRMANSSIPVGATFMAMAFNRKNLHTSDLPDGLAELAGVEWQGRLGTQSLTSSRSGNLGAWYLSFLKETVKHGEWDKLLRSLAKKNRPRAYDCIDHLLQGLLEGEVDLAMTVYSLAYFREKAAGAPVDLVSHDKIPHMMTFTSAGLVKGSERNPSARRFLDFLLTSEGQRLIGSIPGIAPVRDGATAAYDFEHSVGADVEYHPSAREFKTLSGDLATFSKVGLP